MATWGEVWSDSNLKYWQKKAIAKNVAGYCPPMPAKSKKGGKFPHLQPFRLNKKEQA